METKEVGKSENYAGSKTEKTFWVYGKGKDRLRTRPRFLVLHNGLWMIIPHKENTERRSGLTGKALSLVFYLLNLRCF